MGGVEHSRRYSDEELPRDRWPGARLLRWAAPLALLGLTLTHPPYGAAAAGQVSRIAGDPGWLAVHLGLLAAVAAFDVALLTWPGPAAGPARRLRQFGVLTHLVGYSAFVGVDGIAGGLLADRAAGAGANLRPGLTAAVTALFSATPVVGLALVAGVGWLLAALTVLVAAAARPALLPAAGLLLAAVLSLTFSHSPPAGPVGAGLAIAAVAALDLAGRKNAAAQDDGSQTAAGGSASAG